MQQMGIDSLPGGGRGQSFYHVLAEDHSTRYVAQENIDVVVVPLASTKHRRRRRAGDGEGGDGQAEEGGTGDGDGDGDGDRDEGTLDPGPPTDILRIAGRYFKRWDARAGRFMSNVRDEYPDD
ncbi:F-box protein 21 [Microdochium nivale]|nr:F-box protein 21 [Microdochium nivale]